MLALSSAERDEDRLIAWFRYIVEPFATAIRFVHLVVIFIPVIITVPVIWLGARVPHRDHERSGALWWYAMLSASMERAGAAFIKLGQWAASRTDVFPAELCTLLSALHSHAPAHSALVTRRTLERAFGRPFHDIFDDFDEKPLGVGAIAQVYRARLRPDRSGVNGPVPSQHVAVKVLHPRIEHVVRRDLRIMAFFAALIDAVPTMEWLSFPDEVRQFGTMMRLQLDLRIEAANLTVFRRNFRRRPTADFPAPYPQYTSRQVLVEEFAPGIPLEHFLRNGGGPFRTDLADQGLDAFLHMLLVDNFVHADLHPGNILVRFSRPAPMDVRAHLPSFLRRDRPPSPHDDDDETERILARLRPHRHDPAAWHDALTRLDADGYRPQLTFIDTGLVTELNARNRHNFLDLFRAISAFDGLRTGELMVARSRRPAAVLNPDVFALRMQQLVGRVQRRTFALGAVRVGDVLADVLTMVRAHHVALEGDFINVVLSILLLEGIGRTLHPDLDLFSAFVSPPPPPSFPTNIPSPAPYPSSANSAPSTLARRRRILYPMRRLTTPCSKSGSASRPVASCRPARRASSNACAPICWPPTSDPACVRLIGVGLGCGSPSCRCQGGHTWRSRSSCRSSRPGITTRCGSRQSAKACK